MVAVAVLGLAGSGAVAQGVSFSGSGDLGVMYSGDVKNDDGDVTMKSRITWVSEFDLAMSASGTTDGGLTFGGGAKINAGSGESSVGASNVYIGGESWKIAIGDLDPASHKGQSLNDIGFDGLGVDDVAEDIGGTPADVEVSFSLGAASLAITAGHTGGEAPTADRWDKLDANGNTIITGFKLDDGHYYDGENVRQIVGNRDTTPGTMNPPDNDVETTDDTGPDTPVDDYTTIDEVEAGELLKRTAGKDATKQETEWAAGVSFDVGGTTLGIGMDSMKLMQASISADLGAFGGSLFFAQQKVDGPKDDGGTPGTTAELTKDDNQLTNKRTSIGAEISVSAGANTTINAVYTQQKHSDTRSTDTIVKEDSDAVSMTVKGFGIGVSHSLGGGATLDAGFAKVDDVSKASVGVSMSF